MFPQRSRNNSPNQNNFLFPSRRGIGAGRMGQLPPVTENTSRINKGITGISKTLEHLQQVLKTVEYTAPVIQEYGPMVKNLPAMYRMVKAFNKMEESSEEKEEIDHSKLKENKQINEPKNEPEDADLQPGEKTKDGESRPKLYI